MIIILFSSPPPNRGGDFYFFNFFPPNRGPRTGKIIRSETIRNYPKADEIDPKTSNKKWSKAPSNTNQSLTD